MSIVACFDTQGFTLAQVQTVLHQKYGGALAWLTVNLAVALQQKPTLT